LTGVSIPELLIASHIKPWRKSDDVARLDPMNGLLLVSHADKLFDKYLMSFKEHNGEFLSVIQLGLQGEVEKLGLRENMPLDLTRLSPEHKSKLQNYLIDHYNEYCDRQPQLGATN
jgi:hypothetical protein